MGKECCSNVSSRLWGEALRDETKNGCEGDYDDAVDRRKLGLLTLSFYSSLRPQLKFNFYLKCY